MLISYSQKVPLCESVDSAMFEWRVDLTQSGNGDFISPPVQSKLVTTTCGVRRSNGFFDLHIFVGSEMGITSLLTSGM